MTPAYLILFIAFLDNFAMLPTVAPYAEGLGARLTGVGVAVGAYSVTNLGFNLVGGILLDRIGRRRLVVVSLCLVSASMLAYPLVTSLEWLIAVRLLHGVGGGILVPAVFTVLGDLAPLEGRGRAMGRAGAVIGIAAVLAPGLAGALRQTAGFTAVFLAVAVAAAVGAVVAVWLLAETRPTVRSTTASAGVVTLLRRRDLQLAYLTAFVFTGAVGSLAAFLPVLAEGMGLTAAASGGLFTLFAAFAVAVMLSRAAGLAEGRGAGVPIAVGLAFFTAALAVLASGPAPAMTAMAAAVFGVGYGLVFPAMAGTISASASPGERGRAFGLFLAFFSLGFVVVPPIGGLVGDAWPVAGPFAPGAALCVAGIVIACMHRGDVTGPDTGATRAGTVGEDRR